jgi:hypothetical protein
MIFWGVLVSVYAGYALFASRLYFMCVCIYGCVPYVYICVWLFFIHVRRLYIRVVNTSLEHAQLMGRAQLHGIAGIHTSNVQKFCNFRHARKISCHAHAFTCKHEGHGQPSNHPMHAYTTYTCVDSYYAFISWQHIIILANMTYG